MAVLQSETTVAPVDAVILIHGTFAFASSADECKLNPWWSPKSEFCGHLNTCLSGIAECWPESLCRVFPWSKPGPEVLARFYNRSTFTWSGANREADRREAGKRLLEGLRTLEADDKPSYHLVGHSYGGTAIWYALLEDERQHQSDPNGYAPLRKLRSWTMLGTPFPKYVPKPMTWLGGVTMAAFIFLVIMVVLLLCWLPAKGWLRFLAALSLGTWVWTVILIGVGVLLGWGRWAAWRWHGHGEKGGLEAAAWKRHGHSWLGLFAPTLDEAILGLKRAIGPYVPIPSLHLGLWGIPINWGLIPVSELPVNGYVRTLAQGGEGGSVLAAIETEPVPHVNARGPMPLQLEQALKTIAQNSSRVALSLKSDALVAASRDTKPVAEILRSLSADIQLELGLFHTVYYEVPEIQEAIALHVRRFASRRASDNPGNGCGMSLDSRTVAWLSDKPGALQTSTASATPLDTIPWRVRMPHAVALVVLVGLWVFGGCDDFQHRYLLRLLDQVKMETGQRRDDAFDLLYAASVPGRATLVRELVALFSTGKEEGEAPSSEKDDTISRYIYDHLKAKESDVVPTLLQQLEALAPKPDQKPGRRLAILSLLLELARDHKLGSEEQSVKNDLNKLLNAGGTDDVEIEYAQRILKTINGGTGTLRRGEGSKPNEPK